MTWYAMVPRPVERSPSVGKGRSTFELPNGQRALEITVVYAFLRWSNLESLFHPALIKPHIKEGGSPCTLEPSDLALQTNSRANTQRDQREKRSILVNAGHSTHLSMYDEGACVTNKL